MKRPAYRNLNTHIPMPAFARLDTGPPPFAGDSACAMGRKVALDGFLGHFFPLRLYRLVGVRRRGGGKGADVLEECETEVFDLRRKESAVRPSTRGRTFRRLPLRMPTWHHRRWPLTQVALPIATRRRTAPLSPARLQPRPFSVAASRGAVLGARARAGSRRGRRTMGR